MIKRCLSQYKRWADSAVSQDGTHHTFKNERLYSHSFKCVLPFHDPGLAPVQHESGKWFHVTFPSGTAAYRQRFDRVFGFYQGLACAVLESSWFHVHPDGSRFDSSFVWAWAGNFQNGACVVRNASGEYFHQLRDKTVIGPYLYCGDFREGCAAVRLSSGLCTHVRMDGTHVHGKTFFDLGVYHKGFAVARDADGWFHIDMNGNDILKGRRFKLLEPFYNSHAAATRNDGTRVIINENGEEVHAIPSGHDDSEDRSCIQHLATSYWPSMTVKCGLDFDSPSSFPPELLHAWKDLGLHETRRGHLLNGEMREIAWYWLNPQLQPWLRASQRLRERPKNFFDELSVEHVSRMQHVLELYSSSWVNEAANAIAKLVPNSSKVMDVGGGLGALAERLQSLGLKDVCLFERPDVAALAKKRRPQIRVESGSFMDDSFPPALVTHFVLAHVLHDWNDDTCVTLIQKILSRAEAIFVVERISTSERPHALLGLNMAITIGGKERTWKEWKILMQKANAQAEIVAELPDDRHLFRVSRGHSKSLE